METRRDRIRNKTIRMGLGISPIKGMTISRIEVVWEYKNGG
jgi:hypothetical protein